MKRLLLGMALTAMMVPAVIAQNDYDDIYYNPKKDKETKKEKKPTNYIADFSSMDVDDYNRRGFYYESEIDTIGAVAEAAEDFVYTQQIQKYYNPTIVVDNAQVLADVLENSYGNVDITIRDGNPVFTSIYSGGYGWLPGYYNWYSWPSWSWSYAWGPFSWSWNWGPSWAWGPSWTWGPSWSWGWGPSWSWGYPGWGYRPWGPRPPHGPNYAYRPNRHPGAFNPVGAGGGWASNTRPGGNYNGGGAGRPAGGPGYASGGHYGRPSVGNNGQNYGVAGRPSTNYNGSNMQSSGRVPSQTQGNTSITTTRPVTGGYNGTNSGSTVTPSNKGTAVGSDRKGSTTTTVTRNNATVKSNNSTIKSNNSTVKSNSSNSRTYNSTRNTTTTTRSSNFNSGSSRSYGGSTMRSSGGGASRSSGGGSHGGGRGGRR